MQIDVAVVGAGLAGSCLAAGLADRGWNVMLLERRSGAQHKVCGEFLSPESASSLATLNLREQVAALHPAPMTGACLISRRGTELSLHLPGTAWGISRYALDQRLLQAASAAGADVREGVTVTAVAAEATGGYTLSGRDSAGKSLEMQARMAAIACGRHALPGLRAGGQRSRARHTYVGVKCHYTGLQLAPEVRLYLFDGGYVGLSPIEGGRANFCLLATTDAFRRAGQRIPAMLDAPIAANPALKRDLAGGERLPESMCAVAPVDTELVPELLDPCLRLGDAVAMIPPLCGDGMAMAIRSAELAVPLLDNALAGRCTLDTARQAYAVAWQRSFAGPLRTGRRLQRLLETPGLSGGLLGIGRLIPGLAQRLVLATRTGYVVPGRVHPYLPNPDRHGTACAIGRNGQREHTACSRYARKALQKSQKE